MRGSFFFGVLLPVTAIVIALLAYAARRRASLASEARIAALEEQVRGLLFRVWTLEQRAPAEPPPAPAALAPAADVPPVPPPPLVPEPPATADAARGEPPVVSPAPRLDLEQRIGARWATWVGIVAILFGVGFFLKWSFDSGVLGPAARVGLGLVAGLGCLAGGLGLHRRRDLPYLSEGLAGLGLGILYLSLYGAHALYGLAGPRATFAGMFAVTLLGALVAVASGRQVTAVLAVLGGLLTPLLLHVPRPDERNLLAYLLVLDLLVLAVSRFRAWPALNRLAWAGSAMLLAGAFARQTESPHPLSRLVLLSALFVLFLAVPLLEPIARRRRYGDVDVLLVAANAAGYFWAVHLTLATWWPAAEGPCALALAIAYRLLSADYAGRVPEDEATVVVHEGIAWIFLTLAIPLALSGPWVTLAWAAQGVALLWSAPRVRTTVAAWGGLAALLLAAGRVLAGEPYAARAVPVWNLTYLGQLLAVAAMMWGGALAGRAGPAGRGRPAGAVVQGILWVSAPVVLAALLWREPPGLWPAVLLAAEVAAVGGLARVSASAAWLVAAPALALIVLARVFGPDDLLARIAADSLVSAPFLSRVLACAAIAVAGGGLARSAASPHAPAIGRLLSGVAGLALLFACSVNWTRYQRGGSGWVTQVGLSVLWTFYAALALAWGFVRSRAPIRYAALALLGLTVVKVFLVDLSAVRTAYRILSFLVLGVVLLGVSLAYQKARRTAAP